MAKDDEEVAGYIKLNEYQEELEKEVAFHTARVMAMGVPRVNKKYTHIEIPDFGDDVRAKRDWELEEIRRCIHGHDGLVGRYYHFFNHVRIKHKSRGRIRPDFRTIQLEWAKTKERVYSTVGLGLVMVKRRQIGLSWDIAADNIYDCTFNNDFDIGMNSKGEADSRNLFKKVKEVHRYLPDFLRPVAQSVDRRDAMEFSKIIKDKFGNKTKIGTQSSIVSVAPTPTSHAGNQYRKLVIDEAGEQLDLMALWSNAEDCIMQETLRVGTPIIFGTMGETDKAGSGLKEFWMNHKLYNLEQFAIWGYNGLLMDDFGNDLIQDSIRWIIYTRKKKESGSRVVYNKFLQKYPLHERDAFLQTGSFGVGDPIKIGNRILELEKNPPESVTGFMRRDAGGVPIFVPDTINGKITVYERPDHNRKNGYIATCLPPGEKVMTDVGLKNIEEVAKEDKLINEKGDYVSINKLLKFDVTNEPAYTVKVANTFRTTTFTKEHPLLASPNNQKRDYTNWRKSRAGEKYQDFDFKYRPVSEIKVGDWIKVPNVYRRPFYTDLDSRWCNKGHRIDRHVENPLHDPDFWWMMGLILGDGWADKNGKQVSVVFNKNEREHIDRFKNIVSRLFGRKASDTTNEHNCTLSSFGFKQLNQFIKDNFGRYAGGKFIPEWVKYLPDDLKKQFILGYLDSDGSIVTYNREGRGIEYSTEFVSINLGMLEGFQDILFSLGIVSSLTKLRDESIHEFRVTNKPSRTKVTYHLRLSHHSSVKLAQLINDKRSLKLRRIDLNNLPTKRKEPNYVCYFDKTLDYIYFRIKEIETSSYSGTVYNFECETNTFMCHHITTHNCDPAEDDDVVKKAGNDVSDLATCIGAKAFGLEPPKIVCEYTDRPLKLEEYYSQLSMLLEWYNSTPIHIEMNKGGWRAKDWFQLNFPRLIGLSPASATSAKGGVEMRVGVKKTAERTQQMMGLIDGYVDNHIDFIPSLKLLKQFGVFGALHEDDDLAVAFGWFLVIMQADRTVAKYVDKELQKVPRVQFQKINGVIQIVDNKQIISHKPQQRGNSVLFRR